MPPCDPFAALYAQYRSIVFGLAYYLMGRDRDAAEDLTQDTFIRAFRHPIPADHPDRWLKHICVNLARDRGRRAAIIRWEPWGPQTPEGVDPQTPESLLMQQEAQAAAAAALAPRWALLSPSAQATLWALVVEGLSLGEIATQQGRSYSAVKSEAFAARRLAQRGYRPRRGAK